MDFLCPKWKQRGTERRMIQRPLRRKTLEGRDFQEDWHINRTFNRSDLIKDFTGRLGMRESPQDKE